MPDPKQVSPLLDGFLIGEPISDHHGIRCCPAMEKDSDNKYILKIISIPASQTQLDALLLTGAYPSNAAALEYFRSLADDVVRETEALEALSQLEGFLPFAGVQVVPMENAVGFEVYLLSPYRHSLQRYFRKHTMTHLAAVNLGLDLCAASAIARHKGYLHTAITPSNVFISDKQEYRIGDLGLVKLTSLPYASLPEQYHSSYTPPEIQDAMSKLNDTMDVYAIGRILYQAFNGGILPELEKDAREPLPPPAYADYEMAEIIQKACADAPGERWKNPTLMGQAIVDYMQRNGANDVPIVPPSIAIQEDAAFSQPEADMDQSRPPESKEEASQPELPAEDHEELAFFSQLVSDETAPGEDTVVGDSYDGLSGETSDMLSLADELIAQEVPSAVVAPEPIDVPVPEPLPVEATEETVEEDAQESEEDILAEAIRLSAQTPEETSPEKAPAEEATPAPKKKRSLKKFVGVAVSVLVVAALLAGGYYFYREYYLVQVDSISLTGANDHLRVAVSAQIEDSALTVVCKDTHGNVITSPVVNGEAVFENLPANTQFQISLTVEGFHQLTGVTTDSYNTPLETNVVQFQAVTGAEDGSVILSFTIDGREPEQWSVAYSAEGEEEKTATFSGHTVTIRELTLGKEYTFRLMDEAGLYITGTNQITYTAMSMVYAENLTVTDHQEDGFTVTWNAPEGANVESWTVRCYNNAGFDQSFTTTDLQATFTGLDFTQMHTVDVTAANMAVGTQLYISSNPVTITDLRANAEDAASIQLDWDFTGTEPAGGWLVAYTLGDGGQEQVISTESNHLEITPAIPNTIYHFSIRAADGSTVFGGSLTVNTPEAEAFDDRSHGIAAEDLRFSLCLRPDTENWSYSDLSTDSFTTTFQAGQSAGLTVRISGGYNYNRENVTTLVAIRDADGNPLAFTSRTDAFSELWDTDADRCLLDLPTLPDTPGEYSVEVYFNGQLAGSEPFTVTAPEQAEAETQPETE